MRVAKFSLLTVLLLYLGMMYFGREAGLPDTRIGRETSLWADLFGGGRDAGPLALLTEPADTPAPSPPPVTEPVTDTAPTEAPAPASAPDTIADANASEPDEQPAEETLAAIEAEPTPDPEAEPDIALVGGSDLAPALSRRPAPRPERAVAVAEAEPDVVAAAEAAPLEPIEAEAEPDPVAAALEPVLEEELPQTLSAEAEPDATGPETAVAVTPETAPEPEPETGPEPETLLETVFAPDVTPRPAPKPPAETVAVVASDPELALPETSAEPETSQQPAAADDAPAAPALPDPAAVAAAALAAEPPAAAEPLAPVNPEPDTVAAAAPEPAAEAAPETDTPAVAVLPDAETDTATVPDLPSNQRPLPRPLQTLDPVPPAELAGVEPDAVLETENELDTAARPADDTGDVESDAPAIVAAPLPEPEPEPVVPTLPDEPQGVLYVSSANVAVRAGPSADDREIDEMPRGSAVVDLGGKGDGWRMILLPNGAAGYIRDAQLSLNPGQ